MDVNDHTYKRNIATCCMILRVIQLKTKVTINNMAYENHSLLYNLL